MLEAETDVVPVARAYESLRERFPEAVLDAKSAGGELSVKVRRETLLDALRFLKHEAGFNALTDIVGIDNLKPAPAAPAAAPAAAAPSAPPVPPAPAAPAKRFSIVYLLYRFPEVCRIRIAIDIAEGEAPDSAVSVYPAADWAEREIFDMFGIAFAGHPDLRRIYMPDEFEGFPLRKDFPLEGKTGGV